MKKKFLSGIAAIMIGAMLAGCGTGADTASNGSGNLSAESTKENYISKIL